MKPPKLLAEREVAELQRIYGAVRRPPCSVCGNWSFHWPGCRKGKIAKAAKKQ